MKKYLAFVLSAVLLLSLCACGASENAKDLCGVYELYAIEEDGTAILAEDMVAEGLMEAGTQLALKEGGKGVLTLDGDENVKWNYDGDGTITITAGSDKIQAPYKDGVITLDIDGVKLYFAANGADTSWIGADSLAGALGLDVDTEDDTDPTGDISSETEVQQMWNGWWYGAVDLNGCTGDWECVNGMTLDAVMYIELDEDGTGILKMYDPYEELVSGDDHNNFADVQCHADTNYLYGDSGIAFDYDIYPSDWIFVHNIDNFDKLNAGSYCMEDNGDRWGYDFTFMPWGSKWEGEESYTCFMSHFDTYLGWLAEGKTNPFDEGSESSGGSDTGSASGLSELLGSNPTRLSLTSGDVVFVYYPADQFEYDDDYGKLRSKNGSVGILFDPMLGENNLEELKASYEENNSGEDDYSLTETTVNGYKAIILKYTDWLNSTMRVDVDFGASHDGVYGMSFVVSGDSLDECDTDLIWAIIESFELAK